MSISQKSAVGWRHKPMTRIHKANGGGQRLPRENVFDVKRGGPGRANFTSHEPVKTPEKWEKD